MAIAKKLLRPLLLIFSKNYCSKILEQKASL